MNFQTIAGWRLRHLQNRINFDDIKNILDIGALDLAQSFEILEVFPHANVFAFEPCPENFEKCKQNLTNSGKENIKLYEMALGNSTGKIKFYPMDQTNPGASSKYKLMNTETLDRVWNGRWIHYQYTEVEVQEDTLDNWKNQNDVGKIDLIWIDVQGAELDVFKGGIETLKDVKVILSEAGLDPYYEGQSLKPEIDKFLEEQGFYELKDAFEYNGSYCEANLIYLRK
jgi:FkbM family methyltransferase